MDSTSSISDLKLLFMEQGVVLWRHKWIALISCWVACLFGWAGVLMIPRTFESDARAFVDVSGLLAPLLKGLVVDTTSTQTSNYLRQTLVSRPNLEQVIHLAGLDAGASDVAKERFVTAMERDIKVRAQGKNLFTVAYSNTNPVVAKNVVDSLLTIFAEKAAASSRVEMEKAHGFLDDQIVGYEKQLRDAEQRRAEFRKKYADYLADPTSGLPRLQTVQQQLMQARQAYDAAVVTRDSLVAELKQVPQYRMVDSPTVGANGKIVAASPAVRLAQAKAELDELQVKFTAKHPDVAAARHQVEDLQAQVASDDPATPGEGKSEVANPVYGQIRLKLVEAETVVPAAKQRLDQAMAEFSHMKTLSADIPDVDAKAKDLDRDYEVIKKNHDELVQRRESATLSQAADEQADRTQFRIVDPPVIALVPSSPNLPLMFSIVLLAGVGTGLALSLGLELIRGTYASASRLRSLGLPVIGSVTRVKGAGARRVTAFSAAGAMVTITMLLLTYGFLMMSVTLGYTANT